MNRVAKLLKDAKIFFVATADEGVPHVRPFGAIAECDGKIYLTTSSVKKCFEQMVRNPQIEIAAMLEDRKWIRVSGKVERSYDSDTKNSLIEKLSLQRHADQTFEIMHFVDGIATIYNGGDVLESFNIYE